MPKLVAASVVPPAAGSDTLRLPSGAGALPRDDKRIERLRWRCRRGMLENDLILARFLDARGTAISEVEEAALTCLLDLSDNELWDLLSARTESEDATLLPLLRTLRAL